MIEFVISVAVITGIVIFITYLLWGKWWEDKDAKIAQLEKENDAFGWFVNQIPLSQFDEILNSTPEKYRCIFILADEGYATANGRTSDD